MLLRVLALFVLGLLAPQSVRAWTRAHVREASARVELGSGASALVQLELLVDVQGGWLERLELPGLDEELTLLGPAEVTLDGGLDATARTEVRAGVVVLRFERKDGVRRGLHRVRLRYETNLLAQTAPDDPSRARLLWVMPGWEAGLLAAEVVVVGPPELSAVHDTRIAQEVRTSTGAGRKEVRFARIHVPRQSPWAIQVAVPLAAVGSELARSSLVAEMRPAHRPQVGGWLSFGSLLLACIGRSYVRRYLRALGLATRSWIYRGRVNMWWLVCCAGLAALSYGRAPALALALLALLQALALERSAGPSGPLPLGAYRPVSAGERRRVAQSRWLERLGFPGADVASACGLATLAALSVPVYLLRAASEAEHVAMAACLAALGLVGSSRLRLPRSLPQQLSLLLREAGRARVVSCAMSLVWYVTAEGGQQPRIRLTPGARYPGLLRIELLIDTRCSAQPYVLSVLVASDSPAERWTGTLWPTAWREQSAGFARTALLLPVDDVGAALEQLLEHLSRQSERMLSAALQGPRRAA